MLITYYHNSAGYTRTGTADLTAVPVNALMNAVACFLFPFVFSPGSKPSPDMALTFVFIKDQTNAFIKPSVKGNESLAVLVDGGFGYPEMFRGGAYRCAGFYDVHSKLA